MRVFSVLVSALAAVACGGASLPATPVTGAPDGSSADASVEEAPDAAGGDADRDAGTLADVAVEEAGVCGTLGSARPLTTLADATKALVGVWTVCEPGAPPLCPATSPLFEIQGDPAGGVTGVRCGHNSEHGDTMVPDVAYPATLSAVISPPPPLNGFHLAVTQGGSTRLLYVVALDVPQLGALGAVSVVLTESISHDVDVTHALKVADFTTY